jgi:hypothetical protein
VRTVLLPLVVLVMTFSAQPGARAQSFTSLQFSNATGSPVTAWLGLGPESAGRIEDVRLVDVSTGAQVPISGSGLMGSFTLQANQAVSWDSFGGRVAAGGSITFRAPPQSCPVPGGPCGVTKGEFTVNNGNESVDISSVDGINALMAMDLTDGGAAPWPADPSGGRVAQNSGTLAGDKTAWGVFPYRCTQCAAIGNAPPTECNPLGPAQQSYCKDGTESDPHPVRCQLNRTGAGGTVKFSFRGAMDPVGESGMPAASHEATSPAAAAATPPPAVTTPSALITPHAAGTPSAVATPHLPPTPPATEAVPTAHAQPTTAVPVPTARP